MATTPPGQPSNDRPETKLTPKQARFIDEYLVDLNATQAAIRAGYAPKAAHVTGHETLRNPKVAAEIAARQAALSESTGITQAWVLERLRENADRAMTAEPVRDAEGHETGEYRYEGAVANRALELLGKHLGMFGDKLEISDPRKIAAMTDDEIQQRRKAMKIA